MLKLVVLAEKMLSLKEKASFDHFDNLTLPDQITLLGCRFKYSKICLDLDRYQKPLVIEILINGSL